MEHAVGGCCGVGGWGCDRSVLVIVERLPNLLIILIITKIMLKIKIILRACLAIWFKNYFLFLKIKTCFLKFLILFDCCFL